MSKPNVFIIESLTLSDEAKDRSEGQILQRILGMLGKESRYYYIRTRKELIELLREFSASEYRYLHLSCHGCPESLDTTFDTIPIADLGRILSPHMKYRRLFLSACSLATRPFAKTLIPGSGCYSVAGPSEDIRFEDAALLWAAFYRLMFRADTGSMKLKDLKLHLRTPASLFNVSVNLYYQHKKSLHSNLIRPVAV